MSALEFGTFLTDVAATIAQHVATDGDASLASPIGAGHDVHLAEAEALIRRATAMTAAVKPTVSAAVTPAVTAAAEGVTAAVIAPAPEVDAAVAPSPPQSPSQSPPPSLSKSSPPSAVQPDQFVLDHEKLIWHFPDVASRLIEELR